MKAVVFRSPGEWRIEERKVSPPKEDEVLVEVKVCGICGTDLHIYHGSYPALFPLVPGHEYSGVIKEVGRMVTHLKPGDRVTIDPNISCGQCIYCRAGKLHLCKNLTAIGVNRDGGFAEYSCVPSRQVYSFPPEMSFEEGAMVEPVACCLHGIDLAGIKSGDVVVVLGGGAIGNIILQLAKISGASQLIVSEPQEFRRKIAQLNGADLTVNPYQENLTQFVRDYTGGEGADVVIECVGSSATARQGLELVKRGGKVVFFGVCDPKAEMTIKPYEIYRKELTLVGSFVNPLTHSRAISLLAHRRIQIAPLITHRLPLEEFGQALELHGKPEVIKIMITTR